MKKCKDQNKTNPRERIPDDVFISFKLLMKKYRVYTYMLLIPQFMGCLMLINAVVSKVLNGDLTPVIWVVWCSIIIPLETFVNTKFKSSHDEPPFDTRKAFVVSMIISNIGVLIALYAYAYMSETGIAIIASILALVSTALIRLNRNIFNYELTLVIQTAVIEYIKPDTLLTQEDYYRLD